MRKRTASTAPNGFSLVEVVISLGIIAVIIPIVTALTVAGATSSRVATEETRAAFLARAVFEEVSMAQDGRGRFIREALTWPEFPAGGGRIVLATDLEGRIVGVVDEGAYEAGLPGPGVGYLVAVRGTRHRLENEPESAILSNVEVRLESPARAMAAHRRAQVFVRLMHPDD